ncbi:unnamed protein product [Mortierella alpina]
MEHHHIPNRHSATTSAPKAFPSRLAPQGRPLSPSTIQPKRTCSVTFKENTQSPVLSKPRRSSTPIPSRPGDPNSARAGDAQHSLKRSSSTPEIPQQLRSPGDIAKHLPSTPAQYPRTIKLATPSTIAKSLTIPGLKTKRVGGSNNQSDRVDDDDIVGDDPQYIPSNDTTACDEEIVVSSEDTDSPVENSLSGASKEDHDEPGSWKTPAGKAPYPLQLKTPLATPLPGSAKRACEPQSKPTSRVRLTLYGTPVTSEPSPRRHPLARRYLGRGRAKDTWTIDSMTPAPQTYTPSSTLDAPPSQESVLIRTRRPGGYQRTVQKENCDGVDVHAHAEDSTSQLEELGNPAAQEGSQHLNMAQTPSGRVAVGATPYDPSPCSRLPFLRSPTDEVQSPISAVLDNSRLRLLPLRARDVNAPPERPPKPRSIFWFDSCTEGSGTPGTQRSMEL